MLYLQATKKVREELGVGKLEFAEPGRSSSKLGNWLVNVVPIGNRHAFLFMSIPSLLSFPIFIGQREPGPEDMPNFLAHGVGQLLHAVGAPQDQVAKLISDFDEVALCKATKKSELATHSAIAADYFHRMNRAGPKADIGAIIHGVNSTPRATLGSHTSFEVVHKLLAGSEA